MAKPKITKTETPKAPKTKITRVDNTEWKESSPAATGEGKWSDWAKTNPNRAANAADRKKEFNKVPTTMTKPNTKERAEMVSKWKSARPVSGAGGAKTDAEKEAKRQKQIAWSKSNPNKLTNANRALKKKAK